MTKGIYIHTKSGVPYELLDDKVINKDTEKRMVLYCEFSSPSNWYVSEIQNFQKNFIFKDGND